MIRVKRIGRWLAEALGVILGTAALAFVVVYGWAHSESGRTWIARNAAAALSLPGESVIAVGRLEGVLPDAIRLVDVSASDSTGTWLRAGKVTLDWRPLDLLTGTFRVSALKIEDLEVQRIPPFTPRSNVASGNAGFDYLPFDTVVERLSVEDVALGPEVLGVPATFRIAGVVAAEGIDRLLCSFVFERTDGVAGSAALKALYELSDRRLTLDSYIDEPAGGLIARLLEIPDLPPVVVNLSGDGPLDGWRGRLSGSLAGLALLEAGIELSGDSPMVFRASGTAESKSTSDALPWRLLAGKTEFEIAGEWRHSQSRRLVLDRAHLDGAVAKLVLSGEFEPDLLQLDARAHLVLEDDAVIADSMEGVEGQGLSLGAEIRGHVLRPEIRLEASARRFDLPGLTTEEVLARFTFQPDLPFGQGPLAGALSATGRVETLIFDNVPELGPIFGESFDWQVGGQLDLAQSGLWADQLLVRSDLAEVSGSSAVAFAEGTAHANLELEVYDLGGLAPLLGIDVEGRAHLAGSLELRDFGRTLHAPLAGRLEDVALGEVISQALLGGDSSVEAALSVDPDGAFRITDVVVESAPARLTGKVGFTERFRRIAADYRLTAVDVGVLSSALGAELAGYGLFEGRAEGSTVDPTLAGTLSVADAAVAGLEFGQLQVGYSIKDLPRKPGGHLQARASAPVEGMTGRTDYVFDGPLLRLRGLDLRAKGATVGGAATFSLAGGPIEADLTGQTDDLSPWLALAGIAGAGGGEAELSLAGRKGRQAARLSAAFKDLSVDMGSDAPLRIKEARADLDSKDLAGGQDGTAELTAKNIRRGDLQLNELSLDGTGGASGGALHLTAAGRWIETVSLDAAGQVTLEDGGVVLDLASLEGHGFGQTFKLLRGARLARRKETLEVTELEFDFGGARLTAEARLDAERIAAKAEARKVPVSLFQPLWPTGGMTGSLSGRVLLEGPLDGPTGSVTVFVPDLRIGTVATSPPLILSLDGDWRDDRLTMTGKLADGRQRPVDLSADLPLHLDPETVAFALPSDQTISGHLSWAGQIGEIWPFLPFPTHRLEGASELRLALAGTLAEPQTSGRLTLVEGEYENLQTGTLLDELDLTVALDGRRFVISSLGAKDGGKGRLTGAGTLDLLPEQAFPFKLEAELDKFILVRRDDLTASSNGRLSLEGSFDAAALTGRLKTESVEIRILDQLPPDVVDLGVIEIDSVAGDAQRDEPDAGPRDAFTLELDLGVDMPRRVFVRGRGLDSEWSGKLKVQGTLDAPKIGGQLNLVRGNLSVVGQPFKLSEGRVHFTDKEEIDPRIDVRAVNQSEDLTVTARVKGQATNPTIEISSAPELPEDEIISRVLFGKDTAQLSTNEAVQLAAAISELSTAKGGGGVLDFARGVLGVDVLRVETIGAGDATQPALSAGKYVTDEVFIGVKQGVEAESGSVGVEIEMSPNVSIESDVGQTGESNVGIKFKWDY
jgi:translocation and assembly module TamB